MKKMKKLLSAVLAATMLLALLAGCQDKDAEAQPPEGADTAQEETAQEPQYNAEKIAITYVKSPLNVPSIVEKDKKFFEKAYESFGLPVEYSNLTAGPEQTQALASGDLQFLNAVGATSAILAASNGNDIKIISMYSRSPKAFKMFTCRDDIHSAEDLKGKKIVGPKGTILHELMVTYLKNAGLTEQDVEFVSMGIPESMAALANKEADCALLAGPAAYNAEKEGNTVVTSGEGLVDATIVVATSQKFYDENKVLVDTFLDTQKQTLQYMEDNYDEVMEIAAKETELDLDAVKEMYEMYDFDMTIRDSDVESMKSTEQFLFDNGMIENHVNVEDLVIR